MSSVGYGMPESIDGPLPLAPLYGLLQAAGAPAAGVRIVTDADSAGVERWLNGVQVYPYPVDTGEVFDPCATGSEFSAKSPGSPVPLPEFAAMTIVEPITCTARGIGNQDAYKARASVVLSAIESSIVAREFLTGDRFPAQPHLADGAGAFPNGDTATSFPNGLAYLEELIALTGRQGLIHVSPQMLTSAAAKSGWWFDSKGQVIRTIAGTVVIPDAGYAGGSQPTGHAAATGTEEWIYATGPIDIRRSEIFVMPPRVEQAVDRALNDVTYYAERYYLVDWDTVLQAAVLVDRCVDSCE